MKRSDLTNAYPMPSFARKEVYNFEATAEYFDIYKELSQIGEEIEQCRLNNS